MDLSLTGVLVGLVLLAVVTVLLVVLFPLIVFLVQLAVIGIAIPLRFLLDRPWTIEAISSDGDLREWRVRGWRASQRHIERVVADLRRGVIPPTAA